MLSEISPFVYSQLGPWPIAAIVALVIVRSWQPQLDAIVFGWRPILRRRFRFLAWVAMTGVVMVSIRTLWMAGLGIWQGAFNSTNVPTYHPHQLLNYVDQFIAYPVLWLLCLLVLVMALWDLDRDRIAKVTGWHAGRWQWLMLALVLVAFMLWPLNISIDLVYPIRAYYNLRAAYGPTPPVTDTNPLMRWLAMADALAPLVGTAAGMWLAWRLLRALKARFAWLPRWRTNRLGSLGLWLIVAAMLADGVKLFLRLLLTEVRDALWIVSFYLGGIPGLRQAAMDPAATWTIIANALQLLALVVAAGVVVNVDWEVVAKRTGLRPRPLRLFSWLSLGAWLSWPLRLPVGVGLMVPTMIDFGWTPPGNLLARVAVFTLIVWLVYMAVLGWSRARE